MSVRSQRTVQHRTLPGVSVQQQHSTTDGWRRKRRCSHSISCLPLLLLKLQLELQTALPRWGFDNGPSSSSISVLLLVKHCAARAQLGPGNPWHQPKHLRQ